MSDIFFNSILADQDRRQELYSGNLFVYAASRTSMGFIQFAKELIEAAFSGLHPPTAQYHLEVEQYVNILKELKPQFIHHPRSKEFLQQLLIEAGCDPEKTYFDVPRMRSSTSDGYLTSGIAYAFHPHRDTWYSAPMSQINWWLPIYEVKKGNVMSIHPAYFDQAIKNGSKDYDYQRWNATSRKEAANHIKQDTRKQPRPEEPLDLESSICLVTEPGGISLFSAAHLHASVPNMTGETRWSIDFRTVHIDDLVAKNGAVNVDSACTGTNLGDFLRVSDLAPLPTEIVEAYMHGPTLVAPQLVRR